MGRLVLKNAELTMQSFEQIYGMPCWQHLYLEFVVYYGMDCTSVGMMGRFVLGVFQSVNLFVIM